MAQRSTRGRCHYCGGHFAKSGIRRHLKACAERGRWLEHGQRQAQLQRRRILHLLVEGYTHPEYWMHLELPASMTLRKLDSYLRTVWLECCGHLSAFMIGSDAYAPTANRELGMKSMNKPIGELVGPGDWFGYDYDFGDTTTLRLGIISEREGVLGKGRVEPMAVNLPPDVRCACGEPAKKVCAVCQYEGEGWFCDRCAAAHPCGEEMLLPVMNSPRVGQCAYGLV